MSNHFDIEKEFAVLVVSCDKYSDLWQPFFRTFRLYWPDCPFRVYLLSNHRSADEEGVQNLCVGDDISWSDNLRRAVESIEQQYVLLFLDDLFLHRPVNWEYVKSVFNWITEKEPNYVRMNSSPLPDKPFNELVGIASKGTIYRTSTVLSVWKKAVLLDLLKNAETAWDFEIFGSTRSDKYDNFYSTWKECFPVTNGVIKGKWQPIAVRNLQAIDIEVDLARRPVMTYRETIIFFLKRQRSALLNLLPARHRQWVKDAILRDQYNYSK